MIKTGLAPRFAEMGKIKIGGKGETRKDKSGNDYQIPVRFNHFVVTTTEKGTNGNFMPNPEIMKALGSEPKEIPIRLLFDDIDMNFYTSFQYYHGAKCVCKGDGESAERIDKNGAMSRVKCDPTSCPYLQTDEKGQTKCKVSGILSCQIVAGKMEIGGVYRFRTHSWNSVSSILAALKYFSDNTKGILQGLPFKLVFLKKATQEHGNVNIVTLVIDGIELMEMRNRALAEYENRMKLGIDMKLLENKAKDAGFMVDNDDPQDVEEEFYADNADDLPEPDNSGFSADDVKKELEKKSEGDKQIPDNKRSEKQGSLL